MRKRSRAPPLTRFMVPRVLEVLIAEVSYDMGGRVGLDRTVYIAREGKLDPHPHPARGHPTPAPTMSGKA